MADKEAKPEAKQENKQPVVEGSTAENVREGASGDSKDAAPAEKQKAAKAKPAEAVAMSDDKPADDPAASVVKFLEKSAAEAEKQGLITHQEYMDRIKELEEGEMPSDAKQSAVDDKSKAAIEKLAGMYGVPHAGDLHAAAHKLADLLGHAKDEFVALLGKLRAHAGV